MFLPAEKNSIILHQNLNTMSEFTHLHVHTQYSILDGAADIGGLMAKAKEYGMDSIAITDHGNMFGVIDFYEQARENGIKPIIGCEFYMARNGHLQKKSKEDRSGYHLILLAKNKTGYRNLAKLCSIGFLDGKYYTPRIDKELLRKHHEGLIASSACLGGEIPKAVMNHGIEKAEAVLKEYTDIFGEDFYLELQDHGHEEQKTVNKALIELSKKHGVKLIATNDVHFINRDDAEAHDILICLNTNEDAESAERMRYTGFEYFRPVEEMKNLFADVPEAITNTVEIANKVEEYEITTKEILLPVYPIPEPFEGENEYLRHLTYEGAKKMYPEITNEVKQRLDHELNIIKEMGFPGYFLIVQDFINEARKRKVWVGPGRGSAAGSAVAFSIGITSIDPIKYNLLFERFLNPERVSMPDIDIDFDDEGRERVMDYVIEKYGKEKVAQIVTFGTMAARSAIRDVGRVLKLPLPETDKLAKLVPEGPKVKLANAYKDVKELTAALQKGEEKVRKTLDFAKTLEGSVRHVGTHACGVIIGPEALINHVPLSTAKDSDLAVTQYEGKYVESAGMLKMDFLGLKTLSILKDAVENIELRLGKKIDIENVSLEDEKTFELYQRGDTIGTFQFESDGMRSHLRELKPTSIEDLIAMNALYRPGPMDFIPTYINRKQGREKVEYPHPWLEEILENTYGIMVYQEQIMQAAQIMAGYSLGAADVLRRAMGKKIGAVMAEQKKIFVKGAVDKGVDEEKAKEVFSVMEKFAKYGFNRSHSAAYSVVAYRTGYLKAHYPAEYMAAVLTHNLNDLKKVTSFMDESKRQGIPVLGPDVNESFYNFVVNKEGAIRFGLGAVKGVGEGAVEAIVKERKENGPYKSFFDLLKRINLKSANKRCIEALAMSGAFDNFKDSHRAMYFHQENNEGLTFIDKAIKHVNAVESRKNSQQPSLFGDSEEVEIPDPPMPQCEEWGKLDALKKERDVIGIYISGHPLDNFKIEIEHFCNHTVNELKELIEQKKEKEIKIGGIITSVQHKYTKKNKPMASFILEDYTDAIQLFMFSNKYVELKNYLEEGYLVLIKGKVASNYKNKDQYEFQVNAINLLSEVMEKQAKELTIKLSVQEVSNELINQLSSLAESNKGNCSLKFKVIDPLEKITIDMYSKKYKIDCNGFLNKLTDSAKVDFSLH